MPHTSGFHHLALHTKDIDRFIEFYVDVFEASVIGDMTEGPMRHAFIDLGGGCCLHAFQWPDNPHAAAVPTMFDRGHLDHFAIQVIDEATFERLRRALAERGASDGAVTDFGSTRTVSFTDPDGCDAEIAMWVDAPTRTFEQRTLEPLPTP